MTDLSAQFDRQALGVKPVHGALWTTVAERIACTRYDEMHPPARTRRSAVGVARGHDWWGFRLPDQPSCGVYGRQEGAGTKFRFFNLSRLLSLFGRDRRGE